MKEGKAEPSGDGLGDSSGDSKEKWITIDRLCDAFEASLQDGENGRAPFLAGIPEEWREQLAAEFDAIEASYRDAKETREDTLQPSGDGKQAPSPVGGRLADLRRLGAKRVWLGRFEIKKRLGSGATGSVWCARDARLARWVALKVPHVNGVMSDTTASRFQTEARAAAALSHPNVVQVHEVLIEDGLPILIQQWIDGPSLASYLKQHGTMDCDQAALWMMQIADAVACAHGNGIVHRDLKPANVMLDGNRPMVLDFGLASYPEFASGLTSEGTVLGTPAYMSPEQAEGNVDARPTTDVYAMGAILYEMLVGTPPFVGRAKEVLQAAKNTMPTSPRNRRAGIPKDLETIVLRCLCKSPSGRYQSAEELRDDLARFRDRKPIRARKIGAVEYAVAWCKLHPIATLVAIAGTIILGLSIGMGYSKFQQRMLTQQTQQLRYLQKQLELQQRELVQQQTATLLAQASQEIGNGHRARARRMLESVSVSLRGWEWSLLDRVSSSPNAVLPIPSEVAKSGAQVTAITQMGDNRTIIAAIGQGTIVSWDLTQLDDTESFKESFGKVESLEPKVIYQAPAKVTALTVSSNERLLAWAEESGGIGCFDVVQNKLIDRIVRPSRQPGAAIRFLGLRKLIAGGGRADEVTKPNGKNSWLTLFKLDRQLGMEVLCERTWNLRAAVTSLAIVGKDRFLATRGNSDAFTDGYVEQWEIEDQDLVRLPSLATGIGIRGLDFHRGSERIAWGDAMGVFTVYDLKEKVTLFRGRASTQPLVQTRFSADGNHLFVTGDDLRITRWRIEETSDGDAKSSVTERSLADAMRSDSTIDSSQSVGSKGTEPDQDVKPDTSSEPPTTMNVRNTLKPAMSAEFETVMVGHDQSISGMLLMRFKGIDSEGLITGSSDGTLRMWSSDVDPAVDHFQLRKCRLVDVDWVGMDRLAMVTTQNEGNRKGIAHRIYNTPKHGFQLERRDFSNVHDVVPVTPSKLDSLGEVSKGQDPQSASYYVALANNQAYVFEFGKKNCRRRFQFDDRDSTVVTSATTVGNRWIICATTHAASESAPSESTPAERVSIQALELKSKEEIWSEHLEGHMAIQAMAPSVDNQYFVGGTKSGDAFWISLATDDAETGLSRPKVITYWDAGHQNLRDLCWLGDQNRLATVGDDGMCAIWDFESLNEPTNGNPLSSTIPVLEKRLQVSGGPVTVVHASPRGNRMATVGMDRVIRVWDTVSGLELLSFTQRGTEVCSVRFSPNERFLMIAETDGQIEIIKL